MLKVLVLKSKTMITFKELFEAKDAGGHGSEKHHVTAFTRMNPPTTGHMQVINKLHAVAKKHGAEHSLVVSHSNDAKKNPLTPEQKIKHLKRYSPETNVSSSSKESPTILHHAAELHKKGVEHLHVVAGSDRHEQLHKLLHQYNNKEAGHGHYNFKSITMHSSGDRDPDSEGTEGMSGTKMRQHAHENNFKEFRKGVPSHVSDKHAHELMSDVRKGSGIKEEAISYQTFMEVRMTAAMKLQKAFQREQEKAASARKAGEELLKKPAPQKTNESITEEEEMIFTESVHDNRTGFAKRRREDDEGGELYRHTYKYNVSKPGVNDGKKHERHVTTPLTPRPKKDLEHLARAHLTKQGYQIHEEEKRGAYKQKSPVVIAPKDPKAKSYGKIVSKIRTMAEETGSYEKSEENKKSADSAKAQGDMFAHHMHMADHHDNLSQWHGEKGRHSEADRHAEKSEQHHEKAMGFKESVELDEGVDPSEIAGNPRMYSADSAKKAYYHKRATDSERESLARHLDRHHGNKNWRKPVKEEAESLEESMAASWKSVQSMDKGSVTGDKSGVEKRLAYLTAVHAHHKKFGNDTHKVRKEIESINRSRIKEETQENTMGLKSFITLVKEGTLQSSGDDSIPTLTSAPAKTKKKAEEAIEESYAKVETKKYSWGTMKTAHHGASFSVPLHPEHHQAIHALKHDQEHKFKTEDGRHWTAKRQGDDVHLHSANDGPKTKIKHSDLKEEVEQIEERNKENATKRKMMDASRGARFKLNNPVPDAEPEHKTGQAHNKAIGRALRKEDADLEEAKINAMTPDQKDKPVAPKNKKPAVESDLVNAAGDKPHEEKFETVKKEGFSVSELLQALKEGMWPGTPEYKAKYDGAKQGGGAGVKKGSRYGGSLQKDEPETDNDDAPKAGRKVGSKSGARKNLGNSKLHK